MQVFLYNFRCRGDSSLHYIMFHWFDRVLYWYYY